MILFAYHLAGMAFVLACLALLLAIAEHRRADRAETALLMSIESGKSQHSALLASVADIAGIQARAVASLETVTNRLVEQERMIRAVAAASVPPVYPASSKVQIVVPGPGTMR